MTIVRLLCFFGLHPRKTVEFVGDSDYPVGLLICKECGKEL